MTDDGMAMDDVNSGFTGSDESDSEGSLSSDSSADSLNSLDHDLSDHSGFKHGKFHHPLESRYSGTASENPHGDTQGSLSRGSSDGDQASQVSTQSIMLVEPVNIYSNNQSGTDESDDSTIETSLMFLDEDGNLLEDGTVGGIGGIFYQGDADNEVIFGTSWLDELIGGEGNDAFYGFESNDILEGG